MPKLNLMLMRQVYPESPRPFRLVEVYISANGPRTRMCEGAWADIEEAKAEKRRLEENAMAKATDEFSRSVHGNVW